MAENDRWYEDRDNRSDRDDTAWRPSDRYPQTDPEMEARRYDRGGRGDMGRRTYGAGDYENQYVGRDDNLRYGGPAYADEPSRGGGWPSYEPGRDSPAARDRGGVDWRGEHGRGDHGHGEHGRSAHADDWRDHPDQREPMWARHEDRRANLGSGREDRSPWFGREPGEADRDREPGEGRSFWDRARDELTNVFSGGEHRGKGPRGYRRSDERIREDVNDRLTDDAWLDASEVEVKVQGGEVTLDGRVRTRDDKRRAEDIAERVSGVGNVQNNLRVSEPRESSRPGMRTNQPY